METNGFSFEGTDQQGMDYALNRCVQFPTRVETLTYLHATNAQFASKRSF